MNDYLKRIQDMAERHGTATVGRIVLQDPYENQFVLAVTVDSTGFLHYSLGNDCLSNLGCRNNRPPDKLDDHESSHRLFSAIQKWLRTGHNKVVQIID